MNSAFKERKDRLQFFREYREKLLSKPKKKITSPDTWQCNKCNSVYSYEEIHNHYFVCPHCQYVHALTAEQRLEYVCDSNTFIETFHSLKRMKKSMFPGYEGKILKLQENLGMNEAVVTGVCKIGSYRSAICVMDNRFLMGSMGEVVGEKITRHIEYATKKRLPLIIFSCSGGARMQEGIISLMQMAKTSAALAKHDEAGLLYISYLTHPTTGGVSASFAMLGDIQLSEPQCLIGFAGKRVIQSTVNEKLPEDFQTAEFLEKKGFLDQIVERENMRSTLIQLLKIHERGKK
ncbi:acetyl-CoA carboxylase, carboxyltransferase subunit beta [Anaerorhabdus sp.]|jgi:acetyl-CoA carboxylase carboxyl transferase subunit beta|uniref:acetyl-CoA carboxylase, carboxyltransferase subunit beta n=1 Tax=Anaerorhabdus sp. TaxID=1872524 RepID=UPI002FC7486D